LSHRLTPIAQRLRREATKAERILWRAINRGQIEGFKFRRQVPLCGYIVDFACHEARLVVELDGATHSTDDELAADADRQKKIEDEGYAVLRFRNAEVYDNLDGVIETMWLKVGALRPRLAADES
jgi:very-short-patch-repair endonuclease